MKMQGNLFRDKKEGILMMTKDQYIESLRKLHLKLYSFGKKVENVVDNPIVRPSLNSFAVQSIRCMYSFNCSWNFMG